MELDAIIRKLTQSQYDLLCDLDYNERQRQRLSAAGATTFSYPEWQTPLDLGGTGASNHSHVLKALMKKGLVDRNKYCWHWKPGVHNHECRCKGSCRYRITPLGMQVAGKVRARPKG